MKPLELTLAIIKPHIITQPYALQKIRELILTSNFKIVRYKRYRFTEEVARKFYEEHKEKFFYKRLHGLMCSGPSDLYILTKDDAIKEWRRLMGPTKVFKAQYSDPDTIRGQFGLSDTRNATHGSDSVESVRRELAILFPEFNVKKWYETEELLFRKDCVTFIANEYIHKVKSGNVT